MLRTYERPLDAYGRYLFGSGKYPTVVTMRTPLGPVELTLYSSHDLLTVNEIFCRCDYRADSSDSVVVDLGSNIGISAAYFLSRAPGTFVYLFEPLPRNVERLRKNLRPFDGRYCLETTAVGVEEGEVEFGWEDTGRYGGIGERTGRYITVKCVDSNKILAEIIDRHGHIDILKVDIETLERQVIERIPLDIARQIKKLFVEFVFPHNPLKDTHRCRRYSNVAQFLPLDWTQ